MSSKLLSILPRFFISCGILLPALLLNTGCALFSKEDKVDHNDKSLSVVFGYFNMKEAPSWGGIDWVSVKQYKPEQLYYSCGVEEGLFFHIGVHKGASIQVDQFGRNTRWYSNATYTYNFGGSGRNDTATIIKKPGVYYLGAYQYKSIPSGSFFAPDQFEMEKAKSPTEKELLGKLLHIMKQDSDLAIYTHQIGMIEKRLSVLNKKRG